MINLVPDLGHCVLLRHLKAHTRLWVITVLKCHQQQLPSILPNSNVSEPYCLRNHWFESGLGHRPPWSRFFVYSRSIQRSGGLYRPPTTRWFPWCERNSSCPSRCGGTDGYNHTGKYWTAIGRSGSVLSLHADWKHLTFCVACSERLNCANAFRIITTNS